MSLTSDKFGNNRIKSIRETRDQAIIRSLNLKLKTQDLKKCDEISLIPIEVLIPNLWNDLTHF